MAMGDGDGLRRRVSEVEGGVGGLEGDGGADANEDEVVGGVSVAFDLVVCRDQDLRFFFCHWRRGV